MAKPLPYIFCVPRNDKAIFKYWKPGGESTELELGSDGWQTWLESERSFTVFYYPKGTSDALRFTVRPEKRGTLTYWQAWKTIGGKTTKKYVGTAVKLTKSSLEEVGEWFYEQVKANKGRESRESRLERAVMILSSLVLQLADHCDHPRLAEIARSEVELLEKEVQG